MIYLSYFFDKNIIYQINYFQIIIFITIKKNPQQEYFQKERSA
jgi:hypothetical protein